MAKIKYYYDTETCQYERVKTGTADTIFIVLVFLIASFTMAVGLAVFYNTVFPSEDYLIIQAEKKKLEKQYQKFEGDIAFMHKVLNVLQERDDYLYRGYFDSEPLPQEIRQGGTGGTDKYKNLPNMNLIRTTAQRIDQLKRRMYIQAKSYDEIVKLARTNAERVASIPGIVPVPNGRKRLTSGFGYRMHPIYKIFKMHTGIDFGAPTGTPIYATGDGVVIAAKRQSGYGNQIEIDHGFGFVSKYAHLSKFECQTGQKVKRGQIIGRVGSTGVSVAPHLHYEIIKDGTKVNPIHYFHYNLNSTEYEELVDVAARNRPSMGE